MGSDGAFLTPSKEHDLFTEQNEVILSGERIQMNRLTGVNHNHHC